MNNKLQQKLYKAYPTIFKQKDQSLRVTAMCWGFDCGDGWYFLIDRLCDTITRWIDANKFNFHIEATQVKEKYGSLRFYYDIVPHKVLTDQEHDATTIIEGMVDFALSLSHSICEQCGSTEGKTVDIGWIYTRCPKCLKELKRERRKV